MNEKITEYLISVLHIVIQYKHKLNAYNVDIFYSLKIST